MADLPRSTLTLQYSRHQLLEYRQHYCSLRLQPSLFSRNAAFLNLEVEEEVRMEESNAMQIHPSLFVHARCLAEV